MALLDDGILRFDFEPAITPMRFPFQNMKPRQVVCFHWTKSRCLKNEECEELHIWDLDKMPPCRFGDVCKGGETGDCPYKHRTDEEKEECLNYRIGFCCHGRLCDFRHVRRPPEDLPAISELFQPNNCFVQKTEKELARPASSWRTSVCKYTEEFNWCPWFEQCRYAHTEEELVRWTGRQQHAGAGPRQFNRAREENRDIPSLPMLLREFVTNQGMLRSAGMPDIGMSTAPTGGPGGNTGAAVVKYFVLRAANAEALQASVRSGEWTDTFAAGEILSAALRTVSEGAAQTATTGTVLLFFSIVGSKHFQGIARVRGPPRGVDSTLHVQLSGSEEGRGPAVAEGGFCCIPVEWLRTCALPFSKTAALKNPLVGQSPVAASWPWTELPVQLGKAMLVLTFTAPTVRVNVEASLAVGATAQAPIRVIDPSIPTGAALIEGEDLGPEFAAALKSAQEAEQSGRFQSGPAGSMGGGAMGTGGGGPGGGTRSCFKCGQMGHMSRECTNVQDEGQSGGVKGVPLSERVCYKCGLTGHMASTCPSEGGGGGSARGGGGGQAGGQGPAGRGPLRPQDADPTINFASDIPHAPPYAVPGSGLPHLLACRGLLLGSRAVGGPGPVSPLAEALLCGLQPPSVPPACVIAADQLCMGGRRVMLLAVNSQSGPVTFPRGCIAASDDPDRSKPGRPSKAAQDLAAIAPGTPVVAVNLHTRRLLGLYMARGPAVKDLIPKLLPPAKESGRTFDVQVPIAVVAACPPVPEDAFLPLLGGAFPKHIGFLTPKASHDLCVLMLGSLPTQEQCTVAGLLLQMATTRALPIHTTAEGAPLPLGPGGHPVPPEKVSEVEAAAAAEPWPLNGAGALSMLAMGGPGVPQPPPGRRGRSRSRSRSRERDTKRSRR